jgi:hypothetical protein
MFETRPMPERVIKTRHDCGPVIIIVIVPVPPVDDFEI